MQAMQTHHGWYLDMISEHVTYFVTTLQYTSQLMPLLHLHHNLLKSYVQTPSSSLHPVISNPLFIQEQGYFDSIDKLQTWAALDGVSKSSSDGTGLTYPSFNAEQQAPSSNRSQNERPKLLVCHDFKGGYTEDPFERGYSFEFWHLADTFIYFSHNRVTIPPRGWLDAGRRHRSKILGTVIFEWAESKPDLQKCLYAEKLDVAQSTPAIPDPHSFESFSTRYALQLIILAQVRKFDGYLINVETDLNFLPPVSSYPGNTQMERDEDATFLKREKDLAGLSALINSEVELRRAQRMRKNADALLGWVGWLRAEGKKRIGSHWEIIWYDSVTTDGRLRWQDALTPENAAFFMNSDAIFTNYTWARPPDPSPPGAFPEPVRPPFELHPALLKNVTMAEYLGRPTRDIYVGIDVFGRNCYGGFAVGLSLDMIFPSRNSKLSEVSHGPLSMPVESGRRDNPGLSVALFAPGWTWEREKEGGGKRTWEEWWQDELQFWFGLTSKEPAVQLVEPIPAAIGTFFGPRGPSSAYVPSMLDPPPLPPVDEPDIPPEGRSILSAGNQSPTLMFYTNFNRGSGQSWWVHGYQVYQALPQITGSETIPGWTDIGSCFPKPDRLWPRPTLLHLEIGQQGATNSLAPSNDDEVVFGTSFIDYDVWEGGTSLEIDIRYLGNTNRTPAADSCHLSRTFLPLCTLYTCQIETSVPYTLDVIVKCLSVSTKFPDSFQALGFHLRPCILWSHTEPSGTELYRTEKVLSDSTEIRELANGWHSITVVTQQDVATSSDVPVIGLEICWPLVSRPDGTSTIYSDFKLVVGEISLATLPRTSLGIGAPSDSRFPEAITSFSPASSEPHASESAVSQSLSNKPLWKPAPVPDGARADSIWGTLTWKPHEEYTRLTTSYYNVFVSRKPPDELEGGKDYMWLGTSTYEWDPNSFVVAGLEPSGIVGSSPSGDDTRQTVTANSRDSYGSQHIYFMVDQIGSMERLSGKGARYTCKVAVSPRPFDFADNIS